MKNQDQAAHNWRTFPTPIGFASDACLRDVPGTIKTWNDQLHMYTQDLNTTYNQKLNDNKTNCLCGTEENMVLVHVKVNV